MSWCLSILDVWKISIVIGASTDWRSIICTIPLFPLTVSDTFPLFHYYVCISAVTYSERPFGFAHVWHHSLHSTTYSHFKFEMEREVRLELTMFSLEGCCFTNLATPALSNFKRELGGGLTKGIEALVFSPPR